jgi:hypothetical protein
MSRKLLAVAVIGAALALTVVVTLLVRWGQGEAGWTGIMVQVPYCPSDAEGCRVVAVPSAGALSTDPFTDPQIAHADWSGAPTTLEIRVGAGKYSVSAEGCSGYSMGPTTVAVSTGSHTIVDLNPGGKGYWQMPENLGRTCPGFALTSLPTSEVGYA